MKIHWPLTVALVLVAVAGVAQNQSAPERVYHVGGAEGATAPKCTPAVPEYTDEARKARIQGAVSLDAIIHKDGTVELIHITQTLGYGLDEEAEKSLKLWKCEPSQVNGQPVSVTAAIKIDFHLKP